MRTVLAERDAGWQRAAVENHVSPLQNREEWEDREGMVRRAVTWWSRHGRPGWDEQGAVHLPRAAQAADQQIECQFRPQQLQDVTYPGLTIDRQTPVDGPANKHRPCAQGQRLQDVGTAPHPSIDEDLGTASDRLHHCREGIEGGNRAVELSPPW